MGASFGAYRYNKQSYYALLMLKFILSLIIIFISLTNNVFASPSVSLDQKPNRSDHNVTLSVLPLANNQFKLTLKLKETKTPILGVAFDLVYDPTIISYQSFQKGTFLEQGGEPIYLVKGTNDIPSRLITGISLKRTDKLRAGNDALIHFIFKIQDSGKTAFVFNQARAYTLNNEQKYPLSQIIWNDAELSIKTSDSKGLARADIIRIFTLIDWQSILGITVIVSIGGFYFYYKRVKKPSLRNQNRSR